MRLVGEFNRTFHPSSDQDAEEMILSDLQTTLAEPAAGATNGIGFPVEVHMILSAMEAARPATADRRGASRASYRTHAYLRLFSQDPLSSSTALYSRDVHPRGMGFVTRDRLPLGYGGIVELTLPNGTPVQAHCTIYRCRETVNGWFEGALHFTRPQNC
ncbi:MAG: hypothetical protein H7144_07465 [Burkholderiales bacterium]|nr:hypothetical protein [Phycisphaerae bacterium]